jgi:catechol 2,3-dioxygenase-like lactoylglutathione lyase family enzyme
MSIQPQTTGLHHLTLRCLDMQRTQAFYRDTLGFSQILDTPDLMAFLVGGLILAFRPAIPQHAEDKVFTPFNIGLDHLALACASEDELQRVAGALAAAGVDNTGIKLDDVLQKKYVAFKDPDRIQWEFYMV